jgi:peptide/nickel transport system permease protein
MKIKDSFSGLIEFFKEFSKVKSGLIGISIILIFLILMILEPVILPYKETNEKWRDISYWQDNPSNAAPVWTQLFSKEKKPPTKFIYKYDQSVEESSGLTVTNYTFEYKFKYSEAPQNLIVHANINGYVGYQIFFERPDGISFEIYRSAQNFADEAIRFTADTDSRSATYDFAKKFETEDTLLYVDPKDVNVLQVLFSKTEKGPISHPEPLHGDYKIHIKATYLDPSATFDEPYMVLTGRVSGLLGTDNAKRDLFSGIIAGIKWAFLIGMLVAVISVFVGLFWGVTSTYFGGVIDEIMNRIYEFFINLPMLPILISISAVFKIRMAILIPLLCLFSWAGSVRTVRAISLQLKEEVFIEASKALGANHWRIIFVHIMPLILPLTFASIAFAVPGAILTEASLSMLGLGDPTIVTWGQILRDAESGGAFINGLWWWIIPPGLIMALLSSSFVFVGWAMDKILHPKLRTR